MLTVAPPTRRALYVLGATALALLAMAVVFVLRLGPVVLSLTDGAGVHSGDIIGVISALGSVTLAWRAASAGSPLTRRARAGAWSSPASSSVV